MSVVNSAHTRSDPISRWVLALKNRSGWQKAAVVALASKNACILWVIMTKGTRFERNHRRDKPAAAAAAPTIAVAAMPAS